MRILLLPVITFLIVGCTGEEPPASTARPEGESVSVDRIAVYEAVFRYLFEHNESSAQESAVAYYLQIDGADPPHDFLERFEGHVPPVRVASEFERGEGGLLFRIGELKVLVDGSIEVTGGYQGRLTASGHKYTLELKEGGWSVTKDVLLMIT